MLVALGAVLLLWQRPWQGSDDDTAEIPANASAVLTQQFRTLSAARSEAEFVAAAGSSPAAKAFGHRAWAAREELGATGVELRYISGGDVADRPDGSAEAAVEVSWRPGGKSGLTVSSNHTSSVVFRVAPQKDGSLAIRSVRAGDGPLPLWLAGKVAVGRESGAVVIRVDGGDPALPVESMATTARAAVARVVPGTKGDVTIVSPRTDDQMADLVGRTTEEVAQIAAVTTRLDGSSGTSAGTVILLNPSVFATMDRRAAQVVLSHEATHLLTGAVDRGAESWVVEGFADFVALHDDTAPLSLSAGQILKEVKAGDVPAHLPTAADFGSTQHGLGAVYESAWMALRMLGDRYGDTRVLAFYRAVLDGQETGTALRSSFGITTKQLTDDWQDYLTKSASTVS